MVSIVKQSNQTWSSHKNVWTKVQKVNDYEHHNSLPFPSVNQSLILFFLTFSHSKYLVCTWTMRSLCGMETVWLAKTTFNHFIKVCHQVNTQWQHLTLSRSSMKPPPIKRHFWFQCPDYFVLWTIPANNFNNHLWFVPKPTNGKLSMIAFAYKMHCVRSARSKCQCETEIFMIFIWKKN